jgi:succinate-semialdehyde dehydrogenase/glutarate-semialdehyde dehydrogenase
VPLLEDLTRQGHTRLKIGAEWREASDGSTFEVLDPATAEPITSVANGSVDDGIAAVDAAAGAAERMAALPPLERSEILRRAFQMMVDRADTIAELIVAEMGKALAEARAEVVYAAEFFRWFSGEAVRTDGGITTAPAGGKRIVSIDQPIGVSLLITPWNFPAAMATRKIGPAVAAGCTMILKPASDTPLTSLAVAAIMEEAGLPPGVLNVLPSRRSGDVVAAILDDPRVRNLSFTGSTGVGRHLLELASKQVIRTSMELGGNAPFLVFEDADVEAAVDGAMIAKMRNGGQSCIAANRIFVHEAVAAEFTSKLAAAMAAMQVGPGMQPGVTLGPVINLAAVDSLGAVVESATGRGAEIRAGGHRPDRAGFFFEPTVLSSVAPDDSVLADEIFGPIAPVVTFGSEDQAVGLANNTIYGLASYLYTGDLARGMRVAEAIEAGMVGVNRGLISDPAAPFGGVKQSGLGREGGHHGIHEFLETKYIAVGW